MSQTKAQLLGPLVADDITVVGTINFDSGTFKVDSTNDKVGIATGSNAPTKTLEVGGDTQITDLYYTADYPTVRPTIDLAFDKVKKLDNRITFRRESIATIVNSDGYIETVGHNIPRFDHDPVTRESLGLLIEGQRTNIAYGIPSQSNLVRTTGQYNSLTGKYDAIKLAKNSPTTNQSHTQWNMDGNLSTSSFVMSVFVKKINHASFFMQQTSSGVGDNLYVYFNIDTGVTSFTDFSSPGNLTVTRSIETYADGWYRLSARVQGMSNAALHSGMRFGFAHPSNNAQQYQDTEDEVLIYGGQSEVGDFISSYIPTQDADGAVIREADGAAFEGTNLTDWYNQSEGTWIVDTNKTKSIDGYYAALFYMRPTSNGIGTRNEFYKRNGSGLFSYRYGINDGTTTGSIDTTNAITSGDNTLFAYYKQGDFGVGSNGTIDSTDTSGSLQVLTDPNIYLALGSTFDPSNGSTSEHWNGHFRRFTYYPYRLNNSQIANLTL